MNWLALAKHICVEPYLYVEDEADRQERWMDERDDHMANNEEDDNAQTD